MKTEYEAEVALAMQVIEDLHGWYMDAPTFLASGAAKCGPQPVGLCVRPKPTRE